MIRPTRPRPATPGLAEMDALAQRIARAQHRGETLRKVWMTATSRASRVSAIAAENGAAVAQQRLAGAAASLWMQASSAGEARSAPSASTVAPASAKRIERNVDAIELAIILAAILQVIDDLQRRAQRVVGRPGRAALAMDVEHEASDRHGRIACNSRSDRPSRGSAAWSRPCGTRSAGPAHGAARAALGELRAQRDTRRFVVVAAEQRRLETIEKRELLGGGSVG